MKNLTNFLKMMEAGVDPCLDPLYKKCNCTFHFFRSGDHGTDIGKALTGVNLGTPTVLLAHRPKVAKLALDNYRVDLVLTGHTHGGQLFPIHLFHLVVEPFFSGLYQHKSGSYVYVSSGVYFWGMPMRLWSKAEITHVTLTTA